ncbi:ATP-binding protein [Streptomyces canus]|uniref:ATP-binding protein n=1 Tax=Streptomyces canus TaxID=58343 RepID=UPI002DDC56C0|nr:ATP-binding protein [Streptomyces canus]WSD85802.1 caspase family protein [Streptomyces canus]
MTRWFLAAGTSTYTELEPIDGVADELERMNRLFGETLSYETAPALLGRSADAVRRELGGGPERGFGADDTVVVYYSGHGLRCGERHYLAGADSVEDAPAATALATEDLVRLLAERGARRLLLILHTCHAAAGAAMAGQAMLGQIAQYPDTYQNHQLVSLSVFCASRAYEAAHGQAFAQALEAAVADEACGGTRARKLLLESLVDHMSRRLEGQHATHATFLSEGGDHAFFPNPRFRELPDGIPLSEQGAGPWPAGTGFVGRSDALARLGAWVSVPGGPGHWSAITGAPGRGKSALLREFHRRLMEREDARDAAVLLVDVRHRDLEHLVARLAESPLRTGSGVLLVDGVEEAGSPDGGDDGESRALINCLTELAAARPDLRVVATASRQLVLNSSAVDQVDLDREDPQDDMVGHAARVLVEPEGPGSRSGWSAEEARGAAPRIVRRAGGNHLLLRLIALRMAAAPPAPGEAEPNEDAGSPTVAQALWDLLRARSRDEGEFRKVCVLLTGLAFSRGAGLPWASGLWPGVATRVCREEEPLTDDDVRRALDVAAPLIAEGVDPAGRSAYRLHHEEYAQALRDAAPRGTAARAERVMRDERDSRRREHPDRRRDPCLDEQCGKSATDIEEDALARALTDGVSAWMRWAYGQFVNRMPSWIRGFPEMVFIGTARGSVVVQTTDGQGREAVTVTARPGSGLYIERVGHQPRKPDRDL